MNGAVLIMMLTSLPILYYYYTMYYVNEKTRYLIGLLAGAWTFIGVFLVTAGIIRFWYYIILIIMIIFVYIFEKVMGYLDENFEEGEREEYEIEWPVNVSNLLMAFLVLFLIIAMYLAFFLIPVSPARADSDSHGGITFDEEGGDFKALPNAYKYEYKSISPLNRYYVAIITIRMIPISSAMIDSALDEAKPLVEDYVKEQYGQDVTLEPAGEDEIDVDGHDAVEKTFDVMNRNSKIGEMVLVGFYYHEDLETIIIGTFYPNDKGDGAFRDMMDGIEY